jgi:hypothetical protein
VELTPNLAFTRSRYTAWFRFNGERCIPDWSAGPVYGRELYIHNETSTFPIDWDGTENDNVVGNPQYAALVVEHHELILKRYNVASHTLGCPDVPTDANAGPSLEEDFF